MSLPRTEEGSAYHQALMRLSAERLKSEGYEVRILPRKPRVDVLGFKDGEKIGVECLLRPGPLMMKKKLERYKPHLTRLVFALPSWIRTCSTDNVEVWRFNLEPCGRLRRTLNCYIELDTVKKLDALASAKGVTRSDVLRNVLEEYFNGPTLSLDDKLMKTLDAIALGRGKSRSEIMREALHEYVALYTGEPTLQGLARKIQGLDARIAKVEDTLIKAGGKAFNAKGAENL